MDLLFTPADRQPSKCKIFHRIADILFDAAVELFSARRVNSNTRASRFEFTSRAGAATTQRTKVALSPKAAGGSRRNFFAN
jgi:hypothetical protein